MRIGTYNLLMEINMREEIVLALLNFIKNSDNTNFIENKNNRVEEISKNFIGKKVIVRSYASGVHFGTLVEKENQQVILENTRRLWRWWAKNSISLSAVVATGFFSEKSRFSPIIPIILITDCIEIMPVDEILSLSIEKQPASEQD